MLSTILAAIILIAVIIAALSIVGHAIAYGIGPVPSSFKARRAIIGLLKEAGFRGEMCECGAGWGTLAFALAKNFPQAHVTAYEISPVPYLFMKLRARVNPRANLSIIRKNFLRADFRHTDGVLCYLFPGAMQKLGPRLEAELGAHAVVVSNAFALPGWKPQKTVELNDIFRTKVYLYTANKA